MQLYITRHGETIENKKQILMGHHHGTLTKLGLKQARELATKLKGEKFAHIYSSDLKRCVDTAEIIKEFHPNTELTFTKELRELNMGVMQGRKWDEWLNEDQDRMNRKPEGGESLNELRARIVKYFGKLVAKHQDEKLLLISHAGVMRQIISFFENLPSKYVFDNVPITQGHVFEVDVQKDLKGKVVNLPKNLPKVV